MINHKKSDCQQWRTINYPSQSPRPSSLTTCRVPAAVQELVKDHELPAKKQKLAGDFPGAAAVAALAPQPPFGAPHLQQIYANLDPVYIQQCLREFDVGRRHLSAFPTDPPVLQNPERVVLMSDSEHFERSYQPNVALAPPTPKQPRYAQGRSPDSTVVKTEAPSPVKEVTSTQTVDIVRSDPIENMARERILEMMRSLTKENERLVLESRGKDDRISELEIRNAQLLNELNSIKCNGVREKKTIENGNDFKVAITAVHRLTT
ncbi:unnamed protein product [Phaedon cochleariae]|uniref:Uncharacterized protein n=1 Tax=Phaedon cochleariae TaxID=80249 RepID=A0A9N9SAL1_PHACE|nr:unnamed protein product [Phaedon cochleariae]